MAPGITGIDQDGLLGVYRDSGGRDHGFVRTCSGEDIPLYTLTPKARRGAWMVGWYRAPDNRTTAFLAGDGTWHPLLGPRPPLHPLPTLSEALHVNTAGLTVGDYRTGDGTFHGFRYDPATRTYLTLDAPGAAHTSAVWSAEDGRILIKAIAADGGVTYFLWENGTFTPLALPDLPNVELVGRLASGVLIGNTESSGFIFDGSNVTLIQHSGSLLTRPVR